MSIRVLIADDHELVREGFRALIEKNEDISVIGQASTGLQAMQLVRELSPDLVVMDVTMPDLNGIDATRKILARNPNTPILALSMHSDKRFVTQMLDAGADGYLLKNSAAKELVVAIKTIVNGGKYLSAKIAPTVIEELVSRGHSCHLNQVSAQLTGREREVLQLIAEGNTSAEIAKLLSLSIKTIETHRSRIAEKIGTNNIAALTKFAIRHGLTGLDS